MYLVFRIRTYGQILAAKWESKHIYIYTYKHVVSISHITQSSDFFKRLTRKEQYKF